MYCNIQDSEVTIRYTNLYASSDKTATKYKRITRSIPSKARFQPDNATENNIVI